MARKKVLTVSHTLTNSAVITVERAAELIRAAAKVRTCEQLFKGHSSTGVPYRYVIAVIDLGEYAEMNRITCMKDSPAHKALAGVLRECVQAGTTPDAWETYGNPNNS